MNTGICFNPKHCWLFATIRECLRGVPGRGNADRQHGRFGVIKRHADRTIGTAEVPPKADRIVAARKISPLCQVQKSQAHSFDAESGCRGARNYVPMPNPAGAAPLPPAPASTSCPFRGTSPSRWRGLLEPTRDRPCDDAVWRGRNDNGLRAGACRGARLAPMPRDSSLRRSRHRSLRRRHPSGRGHRLQVLEHRVGERGLSALGRSWSPR